MQLFTLRKLQSFAWHVDDNKFWRKDRFLSEAHFNFPPHSVSMQDPPVKTVRKFLHLLEHSDADFEEELGT